MNEIKIQEMFMLNVSYDDDICVNTEIVKNIASQGVCLLPTGSGDTEFPYISHGIENIRKIRISAVTANSFEHNI